MEEIKKYNLGKEEQSGSSSEDESSNSSTKNNDPVSSDGKQLLVKLKMPTADEAGGMEAEAVGPVDQINTHFCKFCNKGFKCGKALGGHVSSAHVQAKEYLKRLKPSNSLKFKGDGSSSCFDDIETVCKVCGKDFPSRKSLYGHMRCHPERGWRGMEPAKEQGSIIIRNFPRKTSSLSIHDDQHHQDGEDDYEEEKEEEEEEEDEEVAAEAEADYNVDDLADDCLQLAIFAAMAGGGGGADLTEPLSSWSKKDKRGRPALNRKKTRNQRHFPDEEDKEVRDAVDRLISLNNGDTLLTDNTKVEHKSDCATSNRRAQVDKLAEERDSGSKKESVDDDGVDLARNSREIPPKKRRFSTSDSGETGQDDGSVFDEGMRKAHVENSALISQSSDIGIGTNIEGLDYKMDPDGKPKHLFNNNGLDKMACQKQNQHLYEDDCTNGKSSANVVIKSKRRETKPAAAANSGTEGEITAAEKLNGKGISPEKYKCDKCPMTFASHQALGGHKSSHNKRKISVHNTVDDLSSPSAPFPSHCHVHGRNYNRSNASVEHYHGIGGGGGRVVSGSKSVENAHVCKECGVPFPKGQALGGHMRCHRSAASAEEHETVRKQLQFDLNEEPYDHEDPHVS